MKDFTKKIITLVDNFMEKNVPEEIEKEFTIAAIHFNVNFNACTKYDLMRIDHKAQELASVEKNSILTKASIYSYILFKAVKDGEISKEDIVDIEMGLMDISTTITDYLTYRINIDTLNEKLFLRLKELGVS